MTKNAAGCCGRGCNGCVWEGYFAALQWWREDALALLLAAEAACAFSQRCHTRT